MIRLQDLTFKHVTYQAIDENKTHYLATIPVHEDAEICKINRDRCSGGRAFNQ